MAFPQVFFPSSFSPGEAGEPPSISCLGHVFQPPALSPVPRSTHPAHRAFSSSNWFCQVEPKVNKELAVCLQCEMTPAHTSSVQPCTHRHTVS